jgi:HEPN domain-containing protein
MKRDPTNPRTWLQRARSNLRRAVLGPQHPEVFLEDLCWDAQQAAEKALKALCIYRGIAFPKTHSLVRLMDLLESTGCDIPAGIKEADELTRYAVETRYPELEEEVTEAEYQVALRLATSVVEWAEKVIERGGDQENSE